jgi:hypothetical protein
MKLGSLKSVGHNIADSLASGMGLAIGVYQMDVFAEASAQPEGYITVDFLRGLMSGVGVSDGFRRAVGLYKDFLPALCATHGIAVTDIATLEARFGTDSVYGPHFSVTVVSSDGKRSTDQYVGLPGKRPPRRKKR